MDKLRTYFDILSEIQKKKIHIPTFVPQDIITFNLRELNLYYDEKYGRYMGKPAITGKGEDKKIIVILT